MNDTDRQDFEARLGLIEAMVLEGRQATQSWGWSFLLWGVAYYVAVAWSTFGHASVAWPITMVAAAVLNTVFSSRRRDVPRTIRNRALMGVWSSLGLSLLLFGLAASLSPHADVHFIFAGIEIMLGLANAASAITLQWKAQGLIAVVWWASGATSLFVSVQVAGYIFLGATFVCMIAFGAYMMVLEARRRSHAPGAGAVHA